MIDNELPKCSFCGREHKGLLTAITSSLRPVAICHECLDSGKHILDQLKANDHIRQRIAQLESELAEARKPRRVVMPEIELIRMSKHPDSDAWQVYDVNKLLVAIRAANCIPVDREGNEIK
jgi:hypothetical protein